MDTNVEDEDTKIAEALYDKYANEDNAIWDEARELYPEYNEGGEDTDEAAIMILDKIKEDEAFKMLGIRTEQVELLLGEMIYAGLT